MKASLVSATSVFALLALDGGPALANVAFTVTNLSFGDVLVGVVSSPGTSTATDTGTTAINLTWPAASSPFAPTTTATATLAATGASATRSYTVTPTGTGTATQNLVVKGSQGLVNASQALTLTVTGVAPIESIATQATTYALVKGPSAATTVTVSNIGNGSLATNGTAAQKTLLGSTGSVSGSSFFSGSGGSFTGSSGLKDSNAGATTATFTYDYAPTIRGVNTATVVSTFTNGKSNGTNTASTVTNTITGQGVAPVDSGFTGGSAGYVLVNNNSKTAAVTISNANGDGNLSGQGSISNLNGTLSTSSGLFAGGSPSSFSIKDSQTATSTYLFTPTQIGASSTSVTGTFSNGSSDNLNNGHTDTTTVSGTGVAPVQSLTVANNGGPGSTAGTGNVGYALVGVTTATATINVHNTGNGNLDSSVAQSISNLNGIVGASGASVFQGSGAGLSLNDGTTASTTYTFNPSTRGATSTNIVTVFNNGNSSGNNLGQTVTTALSGQGVAPVDGGVAGGNAGKILVGQSGNVGVTVNNSGDGNLSGLGSVSNLNGTLGSVSSGGFSGGPNTVGQGDNSTATYNYVFAPTTRGVSTTSVTGTFSNGDPTGGNAAHNTSTTISGQGVAPVEAMSGSNANYVLVGQSATTGVVVTNSGDGNQSGLGSISNLNGSVTSPSGDAQFTGPSPNPNPLSLTDTSSTTVSYIFSPTIRGNASATVTGNFSNGSADGNNTVHTNTATIAGTGVAPIANADASAAAGYVLVGKSNSVGVTITNSGNGNLSGLGSISNLNGTAGSPAAGPFSGPSPNPNPLSLGDTSSTTVNYVFAPTIRGAATTTVTHSFSNGSQDEMNQPTSLSTALSGQGVAPVESMTGAGTGYTLVGQSKIAAVTVTNSGDGNLSGLGSISNLNGTIGGPAGSGQFSGPSPNPNPLSLMDTSSTTVNYVFAPSTRGTDSATVTGSFSNGSSDNTNQAHSNSAVVTGQGVAPVQNTAASATAGYVLVGTSKNLSYTVQNTGDGNLSGLGSISNLNGSVSNAGLSGDPQFSGPSPNPTTFSLTDTSTTTVSMVFAPTVKGPSVSATITTNFSNGNAIGNNQADSATTVLTGQGVAPVNSISSSVAVSRIGGGAAGTGSVTVANIGNGNLATGGPDPTTNLQVSSISGPSGGGFAGSGAGAFTLPDGTFSAPSLTTSTYTYSYEAAKGTARGTYNNTVVTTLTNGSADGTNSAGAVNTTVQGQAVGPKYRSTWGSSPSPASNVCTTPGLHGCGTISFGTVGVSGSKTIYLDIVNATTDLGGDALTGLTIGDFNLTGNPDFTLAGFSDTVLHSSTNGGGTLQVELNFNWTGVGVYTGDLQFLSDQEAAFGDTADGDIFDYQIFANASVPEPATWLIFGVGLGGLAAVRRRSKK